MARLNASELAQRLGRQAEAVCRHYLSNGRKQGNYWQVGDVRNTAGRSMFVRLHDSVKGIAGKWQEHVAARVMLPGFDFLFVCCGLLPSAQHNVCARWGIS
jgi:hypothetical protein